MPIAICGVHEVPRYADIPLDHIVSFHEKGSQPGPNVTQFNHPYTLHSFVFADRSLPTEADAPVEEDLKRLFAIFAMTKPIDKMLFHCFAGSSRSTAAAFLWMVHHGASYAQAYDNLLQVQPRSTVTGEAIRPSLLMIKIADKLMRREGKMLEYAARVSGREEYLTAH